MKMKHGGPAFPFPTSSGAIVGLTGMSMRDYFAAHAPISIRDVMSLMPSMDINQHSDRHAVCSILARLRVEYADAMIAEIDG